MQCPKCGFEQPEAAVECGKCGVIIAKAMKARQQQPDPAQPPTPPAAQITKPTELPPTVSPATSLSQDADEKKPAPLILLVPLLLAVVAAAWWLNFPRSNALPEGSYVNLKHQFALSAPAEWLQLTPENFKQIMEEYKDRFPAAMRNLISKPGFEVGFVRIEGSSADFSPSFNVVVMPLKSDLPPLTESEKARAVESIVGEMKKQIEDYAIESASIVTVDGLASLQLVGAAPMTMVLQKSEPILSEKGAFGMSHVVGHTEELKKTFMLKAHQLLVPGKKRGYIISYTGEADAFANVAPVFSAVTESFRVMERPARFGPVLMGALNGGLIGAGGYLFYIFVGRLFMLFSKKADP